MRILVALLLAVLVLPLAADENQTVHFDDNDDVRIEWNDMRKKIVLEDRVWVYRKHGDLYIEEKDNEFNQVIITRDNELLINDQPVELDNEAAELTREYFDLAEFSLRQVNEIAERGAKIGLHGAAIGIKAVAGVFRLLSPFYNSDDLERDMERESEAIEKKGEEIELEAEKLEESIDHIKDIHTEIKETVPELAELEWF